jgi:predicted alpha-1,2-mannosidase
MITGRININDGWYLAHGTIFYAIKFSKAVLGYGTFNNIRKELHFNADTISGDGVGCFLKFNTDSNEKVYLKVAISTKSVANARKFVNNEIPGWGFDKVKENATRIWNRALSAVLIDDNNIADGEKTIFYTALYHALLSPKDRTGDCPWDYSGPYYDDQFTIWDTFRSEFPFFTRIRQSVVRDNVKSLIEGYKHCGYAADAFLCGLEDMVQGGGDDADIVVADAYEKGIKGIDWKEAYELLKGNATVSGRSTYFKEGERGWVPFNTIQKMAYASASKTLEFAYNDFCVSEVAGGLGNKSDSIRFFDRSTRWVNLWDPSVKSDGFSGFIMAKDTSGKWEVIGPYEDPDGSFSKHFYEGDSWEYSFFIPHQMKKLIKLMGGKSTFTKRLTYYVAKHLGIGNEPSFLVPFLFNYVGRPDITSKYVRYYSTTIITFQRNIYI